MAPIHLRMRDSIDCRVKKKIGKKKRGRGCLQEITTNHFAMPHVAYCPCTKIMVAALLTVPTIRTSTAVVATIVNAGASACVIGIRLPFQKLELRDYIEAPSRL